MATTDLVIGTSGDIIFGMEEDDWVFKAMAYANLEAETETVTPLNWASTSTIISVKPNNRTSSKASTAATQGLTGKDIYTQTCIACHGGDGKGTVPGVPNFTDKHGRLSKTDDELMNSLMNGLQSPGSPMAMPAKGGNSALATGDLKNVLEYLRNTF